MRRRNAQGGSQGDERAGKASFREQYRHSLDRSALVKQRLKERPDIVVRAVAPMALWFAVSVAMYLVIPRKIADVLAFVLMLIAWAAGLLLLRRGLLGPDEPRKR